MVELTPEEREIALTEASRPSRCGGQRVLLYDRRDLTWGSLAGPSHSNR